MLNWDLGLLRLMYCVFPLSHMRCTLTAPTILLTLYTHPAACFAAPYFQTLLNPIFLPLCFR